MGLFSCTCSSFSPCNICEVLFKWRLNTNFYQGQTKSRRQEDLEQEYHLHLRPMSFARESAWMLQSLSQRYHSIVANTRWICSGWSIWYVYVLWMVSSYWLGYFSIQLSPSVCGSLRNCAERHVTLWYWFFLVLILAWSWSDIQR